MLKLVLTTFLVAVVGFAGSPPKPTGYNFRYKCKINEKSFIWDIQINDRKSEETFAHACCNYEGVYEMNIYGWRKIKKKKYAWLKVDGIKCSNYNYSIKQGLPASTVRHFPVLNEIDNVKIDQEVEKDANEARDQTIQREILNGTVYD